MKPGTLHGCFLQGPPLPPGGPHGTDDASESTLAAGSVQVSVLVRDGIGTARLSADDAAESILLGALGLLVVENADDAAKGSVTGDRDPGSGSNSCGTAGGGDDEVDAALVGLLGGGAEPEPLQNALAGDGAVGGSQGGGDGDVKVGVVCRQGREVLVRVAVEDEERLAEHLVGRRLDDGDVGGSLVGDREDGVEVDGLPESELLNLGNVVVEYGAAAEVELAF